MDNKKGLFILHGFNFVYGAGKSISYVLKNFTYKFDIMIAYNSLHVIEKEIFTNTLKESLGPNLDKIYIVRYLPYQYVFEHDNKTPSMKDILLSFLNNIIADIYKYKIYEIFDRENYNFIHLNSIVLYPLIQSKYNFILHDREIFRGSKLTYIKVRNKLRQAKKVIFISGAVLRPFMNDRLINSCLLNNPFDMRNVALINAKQVKKEYDLDDQSVIMSLIGVVNEVKGADFLIRAFKDYIKKDINLLLVGRIEEEYQGHYKELIGNDNRIKLLGEIKEIDKIYAISDIIVRGDSEFAVGRTIYEGLYSGCSVLLPGNDLYDRAELEDEKEFYNKINIYTPRDEKDFNRKLEECIGGLSQEKRYLQNVSLYMNKLSNIIKDVERNIKCE